MPWGAEFLNDAAAGPERAAPRRELRLEVEARAPGHLAQVVVHNLSTTGLLIETLSKLSKGDVFEVVLPEVGSRAARVVWASGEFYGCQFERPISEGSVSAALLRAPPSRAVAETDPDRTHDGLQIERNPLEPGDFTPGAKLAIVAVLNVVLWSLGIAAAFWIF
jgi:hypothetical protein